MLKQGNFGQDAENLLLSMVYKIEDGYNNYQTVKREVPEKIDFMEKIVNIVKTTCSEIIIAEPHSEKEKELQENKCRVLTRKEDNSRYKKVISYPNEKTLLYGIEKAGLTPIKDEISIEQRAIETALNIGKCISISEAIRDFSGWSWSILEKEIESTECNILYILLSYLLGYEGINTILENENIEIIENNVSKEFYEEIKKVAMQFFISYDKDRNEEILKKLADDKKKLAKMKNQSTYVIEVAERKKEKLSEIRKIDELLNNPQILKQQYLEYNSKLPNDKKIFSVSHYEELVEKKREQLLEQINEYNKMQNPTEFLKARDELEYEIKLYEEKTDISKLEQEFVKCFEKKINETIEKKKIIDLIYKTRYLNFIPNCKINLNRIEEILIPRAIKYNAIAPISNNNDLDYRILKGIFDSQVINLENLYIQLSAKENLIHVDIFEENMIDKSYDVILPEGSSIQIRKSKKMKIFE